MTRLGRYEIVGSLARGGMAELLLARLAGAEGFAKHLVIKRVLPELARDPALVERFVAEARVAATLDHSNIVHVHDLGHDTGGYFFVMELLHGGDVGTLMRAEQRALPLPIALAIACGACAGLQHAHERQLVHRDMSPQNVFVTFDGAVKLLDFGIAKSAHTTTQTGIVLGKVPYMSPEQCRGEVVDRRSDIYSLGIVLWEITVGERLRGARGESEIAIVRAILDDDVPSPATRVPDYPPALARIVQRAVDRDVATRYQTVEELGRDLEAFARQRGQWPTPSEVAAFVQRVLPERAAAWRRGELVLDDRNVRYTLPLAAAPPAPDADAPLAPAADSPPLDGSPAPAASSAPADRRSRAPLVVVGLVAAAGLGLVVGRSMRAPRGDEQAHAGSSVATVAREAPPAIDEQGLQADDYLVSPETFHDGRLDSLAVAKMITPAGSPGALATFLDANGNQLQTASYWATRPARASDLSIGTIAFCRVEKYLQEGRVPENALEARTRPWTISRVTNVANLAAGQVGIADIACPLGGTRVLRR